jgi:protein SCO1/2
MQRPSKTTERVVWGVLALIVIGITVAFIRERWSGPAARPLPVLFPVSPFRLTNQLGQPVATDDLRGQVWVADIIFTACPGPCPRMTALMAELQAGADRAWPVRFISLTTDPERDTPSVLGRYGARYGADPSRWYFLTGTKPQIKQAAVDSLKFTSLEKDPAQRESADDLFVHSTIFVVVDKAGRVRAVFEMNAPGVRENILSTLRALVRE